MSQKPPTVAGSCARLLAPGPATRFPKVPPLFRRAFKRLRGAAIRDDTIASIIVRESGTDALAEWYSLVSRLGKSGVVDCVLQLNRRRVARARYVSPLDWMPASTLPEGRKVRVSRFALVRRNAEAWILETSLSPAQVETADSRVLNAFLAAASPISARQLAKLAGMTIQVASEVLRLFEAAGLLADDSHPDLAQWEFADALLHARSRVDGSGRAMGATWPGRRRLAEPAVKAPMSRVVLPLAKPRPSSRRELPFNNVLRARRSERTYGASPIKLAELSGFLYSLRTSPSGGATHALEVYAVVCQCEGLESGVFHYQADAHALEGLDVAGSAINQAVRNAQRATGLPLSPQVILIITARFARVSSKYSGIAYSTILKDVGALFQTMYLVATAMGLAPCALGTGDSNSFAEAIGAHPFGESPVGEFLLGSSRRRLKAPR